MADPVQAPNATIGIAENVELLPHQPESTFVKTFRQCFSALPPELRDQIFTFLVSPEGLATSCTGLLPQQVWKGLLFGGRLLPFLWDMDSAAVESQVGEKMAQGAALNWELLIRKLSQGLKYGASFAMDSKVLCYPICSYFAVSEPL
jgi:hypothetical protein